MPRRAILPCILLGVFLTPGAALAAGPVTPRSATPNASGLHIDPSVAVVSSGPLSGQRLVAATNADGPTVDVWQPDTNAPGVNTTWSHATASDGNGPVPATHPALAWDGQATAHLVTAPPQTCADATGDVKLDTWDYDVSSNQLTPVGDIPTLAPGHVESWPRAVLGSSGSTIPGKAITVYDEADCATGDHQVVLTWEGSIPLVVAAGRMPAVTVLGAAPLPHNPTVPGTAIEIAYLSEPMGGQQDVLALTCWLGENAGFPLMECQPSPAIVDNNIVEPGPVTSGGTTVDPLAAPAIGCDSGSCHVVWTEGVSGGSRTRVFISHASGGLTGWSARQQVVSAAGAGASQFMPSVTAHGSRADVVYLDTRGNPSFDAYQTSLDGTVRGIDTSLSNGQGYSPGPGGLLGDRSDAADFGSNGTLYGYFPGQVAAEPSSIVESQVDHGTVAPKLMLHAQSRSIGKNTSSSIPAWLSYSDTDGDPVTFTVGDPAHGSVMGSTYTPDPTYAGTDSIVVTASEPGSAPCPSAPTPSCDSTVHSMTITNQAPVFDPPQSAIVDEGGEVVVPLHATDPDVGDVVTFSVVTSLAPAQLRPIGRATIDAGGNLHLKIPAGVRAMSPLTLMLVASDTTTPASATLSEQQSIDVTIRPNLTTPVIDMANGNVNITGHLATVTAPVKWTDSAAPCLTNHSCDVRRIWNFGDGTVVPPTTNQPSQDHIFAGPGIYHGTVTAVILWGPGEVSTAPQTFNVVVTDDGRLMFGLTPIVRKTPTRRTVIVNVTARWASTVVVKLSVKGVPVQSRPLTLRAGETKRVSFSFALRKAKARRGTIRLQPTGLAGGAPAATGVTRTFKF